MLTSDASKETVIAAIQAGANDYIIKTTFSKVEFLDKVRKNVYLKLSPGVHRSDTPKKQKVAPVVSAPVQNAPVQNASVQKEPVQKAPEQIPIEASPSSVEDQTGELPLDQTEEEQLQELMEDWD